MIAKWKKLSIMKKLLISCALAVVLIILAYVAYTLIHFTFYREYKKFLSEKETYEVGTEFKALKDTNKNVDGMLLAAETDTLKLYINKASAVAAVYDKRTGVTTYTNPPEAASDTKANKTNKAYLQSQLIVEYYNAKNATATYNSFDHAVTPKQLEFQSLKDGVRVIYTLGDLSSPTGIVPIYITQERLDFYINQMEYNEYMYVWEKYKPSTVAEGFLQLTDSIITSPATIRNMQKYLQAVGYTEEDYIADMEASGVEGAVPTSITIPLDYRLSGDKLVVSIDPEQIIENGDVKVSRIDLLRYFGAAGNNERGYMLVPNASGSVINFNNGKSDAKEYGEYVYGIDPIAASYDVKENIENCRLPVFGLYNAGSRTGVFAEILSSDSNALINAWVAGKITSYNNVYPTFVMRGNEELRLTVSNSMLVVEPKIYDSLVKVSYSFLTEEYEGYSGMANYYRKELIARGVLTEKQESEDIPMYLNVIGGVKRVEYILGMFMYHDVVAMTDFEEAGLIAQDLNESGINNIVMNYQGWFNGGFYHNTADIINLENALGSRKKMEALSKQLESTGGKLYADVAFQKVSFIAEEGYNAYNWERENARYYGSSYTASFGQVSPVTLRRTASLGYMETMYNLVSPKFLVRYTEKFADKIDKYDITGISLRDLGDELHPDKKRKELITREEAKDIVTAQMKKLSDTGKDMMISAANLYAIAYADDLINIPVYANDYMIIDYEVPFYQMLLHGCIDYSSSPINLDDSLNETDCVLQLLEYGAAPSFTITYKESNEMKYTGLNSYYSTTYSTWEGFAKRVYEKLNNVLSLVSDSTIKEHKVTDTGIIRVTYENGVVIYINKTQSELVYDGIRLAPKSYEVEVQGK